MKKSEKKLAASILRVMNQEEEEIRAEMQREGPHIFSEEFEKKMEKVMEVRARKVKQEKVFRYAAATIVTALLVGGILFVGNEESHASNVGIDILKWVENFFLIGEGNTERKDNEVLFEESQIGYLPEGFEKVMEEVTFSKVYHRFENNSGNYIVLEVRRNRIESIVDNEEIGQTIALNAAGLEYRYIYKADSGENIVTWIDKNEIYYQLQGTVGQEEIIKVMDAISY